MPDKSEDLLTRIERDLSVSADAMRSIPVGPAQNPDPGTPRAAVSPFEGFEIIHTYSRAQAIADEVLREVPADLARQAGYRYPVALTAAVWEDCVAWTDADSNRQIPQDETGRLWDVLTMAKFGMRGAGDGDRAPFTVLRVPRGGRARMPRRAELVIVVGPGDTPHPVLTIMQPDED